ncbi:MAG: hypothetical protein B6229_05280 [Spirochaetaceae bacterium 4572_7]|nr:MAG: hypothetical protein B6229_05280 [Spirochaetaceae bacterium 4572_7]
MQLGFTNLKDKQRIHRDKWISNNSKSTGLKIHRALSWLKAAEECNNTDMGFISLWISFNSLYVNDTSSNEIYTPERQVFKDFFTHIISYDTSEAISSKFWQDYSNLFRFFIDNKYVFYPFWYFQQGQIADEEWIERFTRSKQLSKKALGHHDSATFLGLLFDRLYVLRNQLMHGGATFDSSINREQLQLGYKVLSEIVPILIDILIENPEEDWGNSAYPPVLND